MKRIQQKIIKDRRTEELAEEEGMVLNRLERIWRRVSPSFMTPYFESSFRNLGA